MAVGGAGDGGGNVDELRRPGGAFHLPCGKLLVNRGRCPQVYYDSFMNPIYLNPGEEKFVQNLKGFDLSTFFLSPELWNARRGMDELLKGKDHINILLDTSLVDKYGDAIMLSIVPKAYKMALEDKVDVYVLSHADITTVWEHNPFIKSVIPCIEFKQGAAFIKEKYDLTVDLNNVEVKWKEGTFSSEKSYTNRADVVLENLGLALLNKTPVWKVIEEEREWAKEFADKFLNENNKRPLVGIALYSAAKCRTYPKMEEVAHLINHPVIYLDHKNAKGKFSYSFSQMAALVEQCDIIVSADSAILHLAGAMKKRLVGVFGGTEGRVFTEDYEKAFVVQGPCGLKDWIGPCWWRLDCLPEHRDKSYPEKMNLSEVACLQNIHPQMVVDAIEEHMTKPRKIFVCMLTYNLLEMTKKALESIRSWHNYQIFVVDNESTDGTPKWLEENGFDFVAKRTGVAAAINLGFKKFLETDCQYFLLLNNDIALRSDTINELIATADDSNGWAVMSNPREDVPPWAIDRLPKPPAKYEVIAEIPAGSYSCTLFTRKCVETVGMFHERFRPRYIEDNDYTLRMRGHGGTFIRSFNSMYYHALGAVVKTNEQEKKTVNKDWEANLGVYQEMWGFHPHEPQNLSKLGLEWKHKLTGKYPVQEIAEKIERDGSAYVTIKRSMGGWGDILFTTVLARELHRKFSNNIKVFYAVPGQFFPVYNNLPYVDGRKEAFCAGDYDITDLEFRVELHETGELGGIKRARTEIYLDVFGLPTDNLTPDYILSEQEKEHSNNIWSRISGEGKKILIVPTASNRLKTWPYMSDLVGILRSQNRRVFFLSPTEQFRNAAAVVGGADLILSPDTGISNIAGALGIPAYTIFGHRNGAIFAKMFPSMRVIQGHCPYGKEYCDFDVPCFGNGPHRQKENKDFPACLKNLSVEEVLSELDKLS